MQATRNRTDGGHDRSMLVAGLTCCLALLLGLAAFVAAGSAVWSRGGLGLAGLVLLGLGGGLLVALVVLDQRRARSERKE